jgi:sensor histidine kinase regulating citrate/malate metabolism
MASFVAAKMTRAASLCGGGLVGTERRAGLGLATVKSLVELHGGTVSLESERGRGTRVTVRLPKEGRPASLEQQ